MKISAGSSRYFTVSLVIFTNQIEASACDKSISDLRRSLGKLQNFEFHFHNNSQKVREAFLSVIAPHDFIYYSFVLNKDPKKLWTEVFKNKETFYKTVCKYIFENARTHLQDAYVIIDQSGSRDFQSALAKYISGLLNSEGKKLIKKFRSERSSQNNLIQLADYIASISHRTALKKPDAPKYRRYISLKEMQFRIWP